MVCLLSWYVIFGVERNAQVNQSFCLSVHPRFQRNCPIFATAHSEFLYSKYNGVMLATVNNQFCCLSTLSFHRFHRHQKDSNLPWICFLYAPKQLSCTACVSTTIEKSLMQNCDYPQLLVFSPMQFFMLILNLVFYSNKLCHLMSECRTP